MRDIAIKLVLVSSGIGYRFPATCSGLSTLMSSVSSKYLMQIMNRVLSCNTRYHNILSLPRRCLVIVIDSSPVAIEMSNKLPGLSVLNRLSPAHWRWFA
jgi:hypothetical protein